LSFDPLRSRLFTGAPSSLGARAASDLKRHPALHRMLPSSLPALLPPPLNRTISGSSELSLFQAFAPPQASEGSFPTLQLSRSRWNPLPKERLDLP